MSNEEQEVILSAPPPEPPLTASEIQLREDFVREYLVDYNYTNAALRIGFHGGVARLYGKEFANDPYVQRRISEATSVQYDEPEAVKELQKQRVLNSLMKEANYNGPGASHAARVSALSKLAQIHGMESPTKTEAKITHDGKQDISVSHTFDFKNLDAEELKLVRQLLKKQVERDDQRT
jgi:phage terminase small subunit